MRKLILIPIIHTSVDLGSLSESVKAHYLKRFGPSLWNQREEIVTKLWNDIQEKVNVLDIDYKKTRIYQDGLPVCGFEREIVKELAKAGSRNHQFISELAGKGAELVGTEDPQLLIEEYQFHQHEKDKSLSNQEIIEQAARLLEARDRFIAKRIDETLQAGETGLLFLGAAHRLDMADSTDIRVEYLLSP
ncbi:MAG: hypothetical protein ABSG67_07115 [Thermoguttaceae bacterium]|jgi:hypothetical protein